MRGWLIVLFTLLTAPRSADACSCGGETLVVPADNSMDVPVNARILLVSSQAQYVELRRQADQELIELVIEDQTAESSHYTNLWARPTSLLDARTAYEVWIAPPPDRDQARRVTTFTTGDTADDVAPAFAGVSAVSVRQFRGISSSCSNRTGGDDQVLLEHELPSPEVTSVLVEIWREGSPALVHRAILPVPGYSGTAHRYTELNSNYCYISGAPSLESGTTYCARLTAYDTAGNAAAATEGCGRTSLCELEDDYIYLGDVACVPPIPPTASDGCRIAPTRSGRDEGTLVLLAALAVLGIRGFTSRPR